MDNTTPPNFNLQELESMPLLGLNLTISESFVTLLGRRLSAAAADDITTPNHDRRRSSSDNVGSQSHHHQAISRKLKAADFPMTSVSIGPNWQRVSSRQGDMKAKLYFARRKLIWEFVEGESKSKIEMPWSDITAINALMPCNQPGTLQIELGKTPSFLRKIKRQPRNNTKWEQTSDLTNGHALLYRRHTATFPRGKLNIQYPKLLQCDQRLFELSQKPFPSQEESACFNRALDSGVEQSLSPPSIAESPPDPPPHLNPIMIEGSRSSNDDHETAHIGMANHHNSFHEASFLNSAAAGFASSSHEF